MEVATFKKSYGQRRNRPSKKKGYPYSIRDVSHNKKDGNILKNSGENDNL